MSSKQIRQPNFGRSSSNSSSPSPVASPVLTPVANAVRKSSLKIVAQPFRPAMDDFLLPVLTQSAPSLLQQSSTLTPEQMIEEKSPYDLTYYLLAYDSTPIIIVPEDYFNVVAASFTAGIYGLDTESDCQTMELRIIQIYTGREVYIFPAKVLDKLDDNHFIRFLKAKDRLKVGADIDTDCYRLRRHVNMRKVHGSAEQKLKYKFTVNGAIDLQSIARSLGETIMGLEDLGSKYVEGFEGNPSNLGSYNPPTDEQYVYSANDAIVSLKIYEPLLKRRYTTKWIAANQPIEVTDSEEFNDPPIPAEIIENIQTLQEEEEIEEVDAEMVDELVEEEPMIEVKSKKKRKAKKKKPAKLRSSGKHFVNKSFVQHDEVEEAIKSLSSLPLQNSSKLRGKHTAKPLIPEMDDELKAKLKDKVDKLKLQRTNPAATKVASFKDIKTAVNQEREAIKDGIKDVNEVLNNVKALFNEGIKKTALIRSGEKFRGFKDLCIKDEEVLTETVDRMITIEKELSDEEYYEAMAEVTIIFMKGGIERIEYTNLLNIMISDVKVISRKYSERTDRILASNIFINMALDNDYAETLTSTSAQPGTIMRLLR